MPNTTKTKRSSRSSSTKSASRSKSKASSAVPENIAKAAANISNYTTALKWLYEHVDHERLRLIKYSDQTFNLDRMHMLVDLLGNPQDEIKCVQIAGTKGKGSTCAMLASMLQSCGYTVGLYTSPHLVDLRERITIDGHLISYNDMAEAFKLIAEAEPKFTKAFDGIPPTFFEILTAASLRYFADQAVDVAILETGLGGRLDCTTVCKPLITGITKISLDHTNLLGKDIPSIAREKAGVFKPDTPAISVLQEEEAADVLGEVAEQVGTPLEYCGKEIDFSYRFEANRELGPHTRVCVTSDTSRYEHLAVPLRGEHQAHNCGLALSMLDKLKGHGFDLPEHKVIEGLAATQLAGRMEQVWSAPRVILDGAHNPASLQALIRALGAHIQYDSLVMIFGCGQDKDVSTMLEQVALGADKVIFTRAKANPRAVEPEDLLNRFADVSGKMAQCALNLDQALKLAGRAVSREDLVIITGSFYLVGEARKHFMDAQSKKQKR